MVLIWPIAKIKISSHNNLRFLIVIFTFSCPLFLPQIFQIPQPLFPPFIEHFEPIELFDEIRRGRRSKEKRRFYSLQEIISSLTGNNLTISTNLTAEKMFNYTESDYTSSPWYANRNNIITILISDSITGIGSYSFYNKDSDYYDNLQTVQLSKQAKYIGNYAFYYCTNLQSLNISDSVLNIEDYAFGNCYGMKELTLGSNLFYIGSYSFASCNHPNFKRLIIPDSVFTIGSNAFNYCTSLTSIKIPQNVETMGNLAFFNCRAMKAITVDPNNKHFKAQDGILFDIQMKTLIVCPAGTNLTHYQIPNSITTIKPYGFYYCTRITSANLSSKVISIQDWTFYYCRSFTSIIFPIDLASIGSYAFRQCENLKSITIPSNVKTISNYAFENCLALKCVECQGTSNPSASDSTSVFSGSNNIKNIMVPNNYAGETFCGKTVTKGQFCPQQQNSPKFSPASISNFQILLPLLSFRFGYGFTF